MKTSHAALKANIRHGALIAIIGLLTVELLRAKLDDIPDRDLYASLVGLVGVAAAILTTKSLSFPRHNFQRTPRFVKSFRMLTLAEVFFTLVVPWAVLSRNWQRPTTLLQFPLLMRPEIDVDTPTVEHLLVPHLFIFQVQILLEAIISLSSESSLLFPYTCVANAYRAVPLAVWVLQTKALVVSQSEELGTLESIFAILLPAVTVLLWTFSSFRFLPSDRRPLLTADNDRKS